LFHNLFFCSVRSRPIALQPRKPAEPGGQWRSPSGGTTPGPRLEKQAGEGDRREDAKKNGFEKINSRGAGVRCLVSQTERRGVKWSPVGKWGRASERNESFLSLRDKLESGAA
jgi:hypothetical protein